MSFTSCTNCPQGCFVNRFCSKQSVEILDKSKRIALYKKGQYIFHEGNLVQGIYIVKSGKVKVINTGFNQKTQIIRFAKDGHLLGHRGLGDKYYLISAVAIEDSTLCFIEDTVFTEFLIHEPQLSYQLMLFYAEELRIAETRMKNLAQMTVLEKAAEALLIIKRTFGIDQKNQSFLLDIMLSRRDMAELAGLSTEQLIRCLSEFRKRKIISIHGKKIIILRPEKLYDFTIPYYRPDIFKELYHTSATIDSLS